MKSSVMSMVTGWPASSERTMAGAPAGWAPMMRVDAPWPSRVTAMPEMSPPPPMGTTKTSGARPICRTVSRATVPWPAMVMGWSKVGTTVAPVSSA